MAKQQCRITLNLTEPEAQKFLDHFGLTDVLTYIVNDPKVEQLYVAVRDLETEKFPKTMSSRIKTKKQSYFKNFEEFQSTFKNFASRLLITQFLEELSKSPFRAPNAISEHIEKKAEELLIWAVSYAFADLQADIHLDFINRGQQPFNIF